MFDSRPLREHDVIEIEIISGVKKLVYVCGFNKFASEVSVSDSTDPMSECYTILPSQIVRLLTTYRR